MKSNTHKIVIQFQISTIIFEITCLTQLSNLESPGKVWWPIKKIFSKSKLLYRIIILTDPSGDCVVQLPFSFFSASTETVHRLFTFCFETSKSFVRKWL